MLYSLNLKTTARDPTGTHMQCTAIIPSIRYGDANDPM
jgi:hypothetical protein